MNFQGFRRTKATSFIGTPFELVIGSEIHMPGPHKFIPE